MSTETKPPYYRRGEGAEGRNKMIELSHQQRKNGWWIETKATIPCALDQRGLIVKFNLKDVQETLDNNHPHKIRRGQKVWYFNTTRDREIAEQDGEFVYANPQVLLRYFYKGETA